jgi:hypothetical protein
MKTPKSAPATSPADETITLTRAQVAEMIADALRARDEDEPSGPPPGMELAKAIGDAVAEGLAKNSPKKVTYGAYLKRPTANHPLGLLSPKFTAGRTYYQNGRQVPYEAVTDAQVEFLNAITHSGRYFDRKVEVIVKDDGGDTQYVDIRYKNASIDDRMDQKSLFRNFTELVQTIAEAQADERAEEEAHPKKIVRRPFGSGKNTVAAEEAARA